MRIRALLLLTCLTFATAACDEEDERFEQVEKLRALGVAAAPVVGKPSTEGAPQTVTFTVHAAVPLGETVTAEPWHDDRAKLMPQLDLTLVPGSETYEEHAAFRIFTAKATAVLPTADLLVVPPSPGFLRLRYGLRLVGGAEEETVVGTFLVYRPEAPEQAWASSPPTVDVSDPAVGAIPSGKRDLKAVIDNPIGEPMRVGWFVSKGKVKNRRARDTEWETDGAGPQTILVTARGRQSGAFTMKAVDVAVE